MACANGMKVPATAAVIVAVVAAACGPPPHIEGGVRGSPGDAQRRTMELGERVRADQFEVFPEYPTSLRPPGARFDGLPDDAIAGEIGRAHV